MKPTTLTVTPPNEPAIGPYVILRTVRGELILYSEDLPLGQRTVGKRTFKTIDDAKRYALALLTPNTKGRAA